MVKMYYAFNRTKVGYAHLREKKPCQDFSASYQDPERTIVTCCDGHGGAKYIRSDKGSQAASEAVMNVFYGLGSSFFSGRNRENVEEKIKLMVLCEYNRLVERSLSNKPIRKRELAGLSEEEADSIRLNKAKAYGTTLTGAMALGKWIVVIAIGDSEALGVKNGELIQIFDNSEDPAGNVTYSMCQEDAFYHLRVAILPARELDGVLLCSDGLSSPYQSYDNFHKSFIRPMVKSVLQAKSFAMPEELVDRLAAELGTGDDVSLAFLLKKRAKARHYR